MGSAAEQMLHKSMEAFRSRDPERVREVIAMDDVVDQYDAGIEKECLHLLALQNPMARDLRVIAGALKIITDIERVGDYCIDIARTGDRLSSEPSMPNVPELAQMADIAQRMLRETLQAFVSHDLNLVQQMIEHDDEVDHLNRKVHNDMVDLVRTDPSVAAPAIGILMVARYLERIADHITNVGERVFYVETGELKELHQ
jgi:phosphate transport system protein